MGEAYQEMPNAAPLDERAASIPGHVERIMLRDYAPVNEGFHILYDAVELLRRNAEAITTLRAENAAATDLVNEYTMAIIRMQGERDTLRVENERLRALLDEPSDADILAAADVAEAASCPGREGPYGLYDYSNYPGTEEPHVIRDFRTLKKGEHGATVARFATRKAAHAEYMRLQKLHVMGAAISAYLAALKERLKP